jgi:hypothetical protein
MILGVFINIICIYCNVFNYYFDPLFNNTISFYLFLDPKQVLKWCLGSTAVGAQYGSVSALSFNKDCTRLLCGFAKGQVIHYVISALSFNKDCTRLLCGFAKGQVNTLLYQPSASIKIVLDYCLASLRDR